VSDGVRDNILSHTEIESYLAAALDQEACKKTLTEALMSRVMALQGEGISDIAIIVSLEELCDDPQQINDDVIDAVIEWMLEY